MFEIYNQDCLNAQKIPSDSVHLGIFDPPFGIDESTFNKHYKRNSNNVLEGYREAPEDYEGWTLAWLTEAKRILRPDGSMYVFMGYNNLRHLLNAAHLLKLHEINHCIWKYNFGVWSKTKYITSHYHVLYYKKSELKPTFNTYCRFGAQEKDENGNSLLNKDLEDVFLVNKEYSPNKIKNQNKLPESLVKKLILYSSNEGDMICDFFMGNFTTAYASLKLGRNVCGYEINENSYNYHIKELEKIEFGCDKVQVNNILPANQGKKVSEEEMNSIWKDYKEMLGNGIKKKDISIKLQEKYGRGKFSIKNILDKLQEHHEQVDKSQ